MGYSEKNDKILDEYRYFVRTDQYGGNLGDTSDVDGYNDDFIYEFDKTCKNAGPPPRMI